MPTVNLIRDHLFAALGRTHTDEEFADLCFEMGLELDDVTSEKQMKAKELGSDSKEVEEASDDVIYKIEVPANRYDLLCVEGLSRAFQVFTGAIKAPEYKIKNPATLQELHVKAETKQIRPFAVAAILRNITFTAESYKSFIDLQEKLHQNVCRKRTLVAIGTHDLDTISGPFSYEANVPSSIEFVPLKQTEKFRADNLMAHYETHDKTHLGQYVPIIKSSPVYPVIYDSNRVVLSLPPVINGEHSKITLNTKNVFIECTATDLTKANIVLNTMVTMFSEHCADKFTVEQVKVVYSDGTTHITPDLSVRTAECKVDYINKAVGINLDAKQAAALCDKMQLSATVKDDNTISVQIPPSRTDILHPCDIMEDVAVAYGFNRIVKTLPKTNTIGKQLPINKLTDLLRLELAQAGYSEALTFSLCSHDESFKNLNRVDDGKTAVVLKNPKTVEFQVCRSSLLPGLLKTVFESQELAKPIKLFEVSDVILLDDTKDVGARNQRNLAAIYCNKKYDLEYIHGLTDRIMQMLRVPLSKETGYSIEPSTDPTFFPGRQANILYKGTKIGHFGALHPDVLKAYDVPYPCSYMEINIEHFL